MGKLAWIFLSKEQRR